MASNDIEIRVGSEDNAGLDLDALKAKLDELKGKVATATATVDDRDALVNLANVNAKLEDLSRKTSRPNISDAGVARVLADIINVQTRLDKLGVTSVEAKAGVETGDADEKIEITQALLDKLGHTSVTAKADLNDAGLAANAAEDASAMGSLSMSIGLLGAAVAGAIAALPALAGVLAGVGAAAGTAALAVGPVVKAVMDAASASNTSSKSMGQSSSQLAQTELSNSIAIVSAQRAIGDAKTQAAHDAITSTQQISSAEESLKQAEQSEQQAQESLTQARQQAVLTLQQLNNSQADAALSAKQAQLDLQSAIANQQQTDASATSTALQRAQADLSVAEAQQALKEAQENATNSTKAANQANKEGVSGLPAVVSAQQAYQQSVQGVADAQRALAQAHQQATWTQQKDDEAIRTATQNLANVQKQQGLAAQAAGVATGNTASQFAKDMAGMTGAGQRVVNQILDMKQTLMGLSSVAQKTMLPGVSTFLNGIKSLTPLLTKEVGSMGKILGDAFADAGKALKSSKIQDELKAVLDEGNQFVKVLLPAVGTIAGAFLKLGSQSAPAVKGLATLLADFSKGIAGLLTAMAPAAPAIGSIFKSLGQMLEVIGKPLGQLITALAQGLAPVMENLVPVIDALAIALSAIVKAIPPSLISVFVTGLLAVAAATKAWAIAQAILDIALDANPIGLIVIAIAALVTAAVELVVHWKTVWGDVKQWAEDAWNFIYNGFGKFLLPLLGPAGLVALGAIELAQHWKTIWDGIKQVASDFYQWIWNDFGGKIKNFFTQTLPASFDAFRHDSATIFDNIRHDIASAWDTVWNNTVTRTQNGISDVVNWVKGLPGKIVNALTGLGHSLADFMRDAFNEMWTAMKNVGVDIWNWLTGWVKDLPGWLRKLLGISSPSSVFIDIGKNMMLGLEKGIKDHAHKAADAAQKAHAQATSSGGGVSPQPGGGSEAANAALAKKMMPAWSTGSMWADWNDVAMRESGWNQFAQNASSGAFGIAQALGHGVAGGGGKYGNEYGGYGLSVAQDRAANNGTPGDQIAWMINYIKSAYGSPAGAWASEQNRGWYAAGGAASGLIGVGEHGRELIKVPNGSTVIPNGQSEAMLGGGGNVALQLSVDSTGSTAFEQFMVMAIRNWVRTKGGGSVQRAFGSA